ncbi:MAG: DUF2269 domain-containing protein [Gammaproteobacteria bacterium]|nr:DUF2269 domain-containing protein [Gammaproteobacteria bacterium]
MTLYENLKIIHIITASVLFGTGLGTAIYMLYANIVKNIPVIALATQRVVTADWLFTGISGILQPITGMAMLYLKGYQLANTWAIAVFTCYGIAAVCWFIVVYLQIRCRDLAIIALKTNTTLPKKYHQYFLAWVILGFPAFLSLIVIFYLMANNPFYIT